MVQAIQILRIIKDIGGKARIIDIAKEIDGISKEVDELNTDVFFSVEAEMHQMMKRGYIYRRGDNKYFRHDTFGISLLGEKYLNYQWNKTKTIGKSKVLQWGSIINTDKIKFK